MPYHSSVTKVHFSVSTISNVNMAHKTAVALDFIVIGGSSAGLSAAYALRRVGHRVLVLEQSADFLDVSFSSMPFVCGF
jgi:ribulose 1,5-bisphosphate synthetase/thiazole synthase